MSKVNKWDLLPLFWSILPLIFLSIYNLASSYFEINKMAFPFYDQAGIIFLCIAFMLINRLFWRGNNMYIFIFINICVFLFNPITPNIATENSISMKILSSFVILPTIFLTGVAVPIEYLHLVTRAYFFITIVFVVLANQEKILVQAKDIAKRVYFVSLIVWVSSLIYYKLK